MASLEITLSGVTIPTNTSVTLTVLEDVGDDGGTSTYTAQDGSTYSYDNSASTTLTSGTTSYTLSGFDASTGNRVWPIYEPSNSDVTLTAELTEATSVTIAPPTAPGNLRVSGVTDTPDVSLAWNDVSSEDEYRVYRATSPGSTLTDYTQIATVAANTTTYTDTTVSLGTRYYYVVTAANTNGESSPSGEVRAEPNGDDLTESVVWDSEREWQYGSFSDTDTDGAGSLTLDASASPQSFDYTLDLFNPSANAGTPSASVEIRDASSGTVLASDSQTLNTAGTGDTINGSFSIDISTHPDLEFEANASADSGSDADASGSISGPINHSNTTIVSASVTNGGSDTDTATNTYLYTESGTWTSLDWDFTNTTTATTLSWSGVTLPNPGDSLSVTITEVGGGASVQVTPSAGSGSELFDLAPGDTYRVGVDMSTASDGTTPSVGSLTLETHTPPTGLTTVDARDTEVDLSWGEISVADGYEIYQSETSPVTTSDTLAYSNTDPTTTTTTISGLENGEQYYFNVRAVYSGE